MPLPMPKSDACAQLMRLLRADAALSLSRSLSLSLSRLAISRTCVKLSCRERPALSYFICAACVAVAAASAAAAAVDSLSVCV